MGADACFPRESTGRSEPACTVAPRCNAPKQLPRRSDGNERTIRRRRLLLAPGLPLIAPTRQQMHQYDFARDSAKPVRLIDSDETLTTPLLPGLERRAAEMFAR